MRIMTSNIWGDYFNNPVSDREDNIYQIYQTYQPDVIGFQEITGSWYKSNLWERLSAKYRLIGTMLRDNENFVPLAVLKDYSVIAYGFEFLTDTPDPSKAVTWAVLKHPKIGKVFGVANTHFWWMTGEEHDAIREINARQLSALLKQLSLRYKCPVFAFGDMNCTYESIVFTKVYPSENVVPLFDSALEKDDVASHHGDPEKDENGRFHGKKTTCGHMGSIDHIVGYGEGWKTIRYRVVTDSFALDATDHSPVYADIELV